MITVLGVVALVVVGLSASVSLAILAICLAENSFASGDRQPNGKPLTLWYAYRYCFTAIFSRTGGLPRALAVVLGLRD